MDGSRSYACNHVTAVVAREFEPTRIEHQLLTQTFDLVCKAVVTQEASTNSTTTSPRAINAVSDLPAEENVAGRRVA